MILHKLGFDAVNFGTLQTPPAGWGFSLNGSAGNVKIEKFLVLPNLESAAFAFTVTSDGTVDTYRSEFTGDGPGSPGIAGVNSALTVGTERWVAFSCWPESPSYSDRNHVELFWQTHITQDSGGGRFPPLSLYLKGNAVMFNHRYNSNLNGNNDNNAQTRAVRIGTIIPGQRMNFVIHYKLAHSAPGITEVWMNGQLVYRDLVRPNWYNDSGRVGYMKFGCYATSWRGTSVAVGTVRKWVFDRYIVGDENETVLSMSSFLPVLVHPEVVGDNLAFG